MGSGEGTGVELEVLEIQSSLISSWTIWLLIYHCIKSASCQCCFPIQFTLAIFSRPFTGPFGYTGHCWSPHPSPDALLLGFHDTSSPNLLWSLCFLSVSVMGSWLSFTSIWCSCMSVLYFLTVSFCMFLSMISFTLMVSSILKCYQTHIPCVVLLCLSSRSVCSTAFWISLLGPLPGFWCFLPFQYHLFRWADLPFIPSDPNKKPGS